MLYGILYKRLKCKRRQLKISIRSVILYIQLVLKPYLLDSEVSSGVFKLFFVRYRLLSGYRCKVFSEIG